MKMRLVHCATVSFRSTEATNLEAEMKRKHMKLQPGEAAVFFSEMGRQAMFVRAPTTVELQMGKPRTLTVSVRFRLDGGSWWQNLKEFFTACEEFGIDVTSLRAKVYEYAEEIGVAVERKLRAVG